MKKKKYIFVCLCILCIFIIYFIGNNKTAPKALSKSGIYFDTMINITIYTNDSKGETLLTECMNLMKRYDTLFNSKNPKSDIYLINHNKGNWTTISPDTLTLLQDAVTYGKLSNGSFAITIGSISSLWDFHENSHQIPEASEIEQLLPTVNDDFIEFNDKGQVRLLNSSTNIDVGGIAKGYIGEKLKKYLLDKGISKGILNLGGNVLTLESKDNKSPYKIGIQKPFASDGEVIASVEATNCSIVSSGNYQRYFYKDDVLYYHILDSKTGYPVKSDLNGVTIFCDNSTYGDALSTIVYTMGLEKGMSFVNHLDHVEAMFIDKNNKVYFSNQAQKKYHITLMK